MKKAAKAPVAMVIVLSLLGVFFASDTLELTPGAFPTAEEVASVDVLDDASGERISIEDSEEIAQLLDALGASTFLFGTYDGGETNGTHYQITFEDASGQSLLYVQLSDASGILLGDYRYSSDVSAFYNDIVALDWSQTEGK